MAKNTIKLSTFNHETRSLTRNPAASSGALNTNWSIMRHGPNHRRQRNPRRKPAVRSRMDRRTLNGLRCYSSLKQVCSAPKFDHFWWFWSAIFGQATDILKLPPETIFKRAGRASKAIEKSIFCRNFHQRNLKNNKISGTNTYFERVVLGSTRTIYYQLLTVFPPIPPNSLLDRGLLSKKHQAANKNSCSISPAAK